ncbi:hypothetical protein K503DRAFT_777891 [Rhizopogon vinicolor AM-OR11-026]|uniref:Uncharacterized protein n=1 Tax=Rhizopogon vinicolor AM-OR11-026 TaxID=1314800 RepID=A0A1B7MEI4_9AGAM|nr:hypothetical protein K503DRAFT_777891 [Rhizopogon vinicolor AM-OR11-026]
MTAFEDTELHIAFVVARALKAIVGDQADYALLKPTASFQSRRRSRMQPVTEVLVPGIPPSSINVTPYSIKSHSKLSESLSVASSETSSKKELDQVRRVSGATMYCTLQTQSSRLVSTIAPNKPFRLYAGLRGCFSILLAAIFKRCNLTMAVCTCVFAYIPC